MQQQGWEQSEKRKGQKRQSQRREKHKKEDPRGRKCRKVAKHSVFPMIRGSGEWKSRLAKAAGAEPFGEMREEKLHAVVARTAFRHDNPQYTSTKEHFWKLRCGKSARGCGAKHISKSKCQRPEHWSTFGSWAVQKDHKVHAVVERNKISKTKRTKHPKLRALLEVQMFKKCTALRCKKCLKAHHARITFGGCDIEKVHAIVARRCAKHSSKSKW